jgi:class 3 adenylate cyclase/tetratricopeptide (TPR) repeat protein
VSVGCPTCGFFGPDDAAFCGACGAALGRSCPECGAGPLAAAVSYCTACGVALEDARLSVERKTVSVVFVDLVGFTSLAERLDPEDVRSLLEPYYGSVRAELERYGGTVEKFIGDAVMAIFGAPTAHEDDPERAVRAAHAVRQVVADLGTGEVLRVHIGVATGEAAVELEPRRAEGEAMAHGDVVNTAARLQSAAPVDSILVDERTYRATRFQVEFRAGPLLHAKGKSNALPVWEVVAPRGQPGTDRLRHERALVGRAHEVDVLAGALEDVVAHRGSRLVTLAGPPGIGKSRLVWELSQRIEQGAEMVFWRQGRALPYGDGVTFWALADIVKGHAGILATDPAGLVEEKLRIAVDDIVSDGDEARWITGHLAPLAGLTGPRDLRSDHRVEAFAAWRRFLESIAARRPLVLVFEDLHWADDGLLDFISEHLGDRFAGDVLVVTTCRPELIERRPGWGAGPGATIVTVEPLSGEETSRLVAEMLDLATLPQELASALLARAGGNPLYAVEYVRMLLDRDLLRMDDASWRLTASDLPLPESVQAIVAARLDALPREEKSLIQDAAVLGKSFWLGAVAGLGGRSRWAAEEHLYELERKELVRGERRSIVHSEPQFSFLHAIVRDVAYGQIPRALRAEKHRRAAEWMESLSPDRADDRSEMLAHHYLSALDFARAAGQDTATLTERARFAIREAGDRATSLNAFPRAVRFYRTALELWPRADPERADLLLRLGKGEFHAEGAGDEALAEARDEFLARGERESAAEAIVLLGELLWMRGEAEAFLRFEEAAALLGDAPPSHAKAHVLSSLARFLTIAEKNERAIGVGLEALAMADDLGLEEIRAHALAGIGRARIRVGNDRGFADLEQSIDVSVRINSPESVRGYVNLGNALVETGALDRAFRLYDSGRQAARRFGDADRILWLEGERLYEWYWRGLWEECFQLADSLVAQVEAGSPNAIEQDARFVRSRIRLARGDSPGAHEDAARALDLGRRAGYFEMLVPALALSARVLASEGRLESAAAHVGELLSLWPARVPTSYWVADLGFTVPALGSVPSFVEAASRAAGSRWLDGAVAAAVGDFQQSAESYAAIGSRPDEAVARLRAAEALLQAGGREEGESERVRALELARRLGADAHVREAEMLLALPR